MKDYKELLAAVSAMEGTMPQPTVNYVAMDIEGTGSLSVKAPRKYDELLEEVSAFDVLVQQPKPKKSQVIVDKGQQPAAAWPKPTQQQTQTTPAKAEGAKQSGMKIPNFKGMISFPKSTPSAVKTGQVTKTPAKQQPMAKKTHPQAKPLEQTATEELTKTIKQANIKPAPIAPEVEPAYEKHAKSLVLPTLSLTDQVAELDKIINSLKEWSFDTKQMEIVRLEVQGLSDWVDSYPPIAHSQIDLGMIALRKAKIAEALKLINGS